MYLFVHLHFKWILNCFYWQDYAFWEDFFSKNALFLLIDLGYTSM